MTLTHATDSERLAVIDLAERLSAINQTYFCPRLSDPNVTLYYGEREAHADLLIVQARLLSGDYSAAYDRMYGVLMFFYDVDERLPAFNLKTRQVEMGSDEDLLAEECDAITEQLRRLSRAARERHYAERGAL